MRHPTNRAGGPSAVKKAGIHKVSWSFKFKDQLVNVCCPNAVWERVAASTGAPYHNLETFVGPSKAMTKLVNKTYE